MAILANLGLGEHLNFLRERLAGGEKQRKANGRRCALRLASTLYHLTQQVLEVVRRDPGCRVLVVVNVRYGHHIRLALRQYPEIEVVPYSTFEHPPEADSLRPNR